MVPSNLCSTAQYTVYVSTSGASACVWRACLLSAVYRVPDYTGEPTESDEMKPVWMHPHKIPYDKMWADDIHWYPLLLRGATFHGVFAFKDTHTLVWHNLKEVQQLEKVTQMDLL